MKYLKKWIETNFQVSEQSEKSSGSCYYTINNTMVIRLSDHFSPIPISRIDMEIVSALNSDIFAIRYDGNLSFFLHDRQETKNIINVLTEYHFANKYKKEIDHIIQEKQKDSIIMEYSKLLTVTKTIIKKRPSLLCINNQKSFQKEMDKFEFYNVLDKESKEIVKNSFIKGIRKERLIDLIIRLYNVNDASKSKEISKDMLRFILIMKEEDKREDEIKKAEELMKELCGE